MGKMPRVYEFTKRFFALSIIGAILFVQPFSSAQAAIPGIGSIGSAVLGCSGISGAITGALGSIGSSITGAVGSAASSAVGSAASGALGSAGGAISGALGGALGGIAGGVVGGILGGGGPVPTNPLQLTSKAYCGDGIAYALAKMVLAQMTQSMVNWINSGFNGNPTFLTNPTTFFGNIANTQLKQVVNNSMYNSSIFVQQAARNVVSNTARQNTAQPSVGTQITQSACATQAKALAAQAGSVTQNFRNIQQQTDSPFGPISPATPDFPTVEDTNPIVSPATPNFPTTSDNPNLTNPVDDSRMRPINNDAGVTNQPQARTSFFDKLFALFSNKKSQTAQVTAATPDFPTVEDTNPIVSPATPNFPTTSDAPSRAYQLSNGTDQVTSYSSAARTLSQNCTLPATPAQEQAAVKKFSSNFNYGGWNAWYQITQNPMNNVFGAQAAVKTQIATKQQAAVAQQQQELLQNNGFLNIKRCVKYSDARPDDSDFGSLSTVSADGDSRCVEWETVTPGRAVVSNLDSVTQSSVRQLELIDQINQSLASIFDALVNQLFTQGFKSLAQSSIGASAASGAASAYNAYRYNNAQNQSITNGLNTVRINTQQYIVIKKDSANTLSSIIGLIQGANTATCQNQQGAITGYQQTLPAYQQTLSETNQVLAALDQALTALNNFQSALSYSTDPAATSQLATQYATIANNLPNQGDIATAQNVLNGQKQTYSSISNVLKACTAPDLSTQPI